MFQKNETCITFFSLYGLILALTDTHKWLILWLKGGDFSSQTTGFRSKKKKKVIKVSFFCTHFSLYVEYCINLYCILVKLLEDYGFSVAMVYRTNVWVAENLTRFSTTQTLHKYLIFLYNLYVKKAFHYFFQIRKPTNYCLTILAEPKVPPQSPRNPRKQPPLTSNLSPLTLSAHHHPLPPQAAPQVCTNRTFSKVVEARSYSEH